MMNYQSPIELCQTNPIFDCLRDETDNMILRAVVHADVNVDKEELIKALEYDRGQYEKGFSDGVLHERKNLSIIESALRYYIQHLECEIGELLDHGEDVGFLPQYVKDAEDALIELSV